MNTLSNGIVVWLRQLFCIHGPIGTCGITVYRQDGMFAYDFCKRCEKITMRHYSA